MNDEFGEVMCEREILRVIGVRLRTLRQGRGFTQDALAERANVDQAHLARIERGVKGASLRTLSHLADALGVSVAALLAEPKDSAREEIMPLVNMLTEQQFALLKDVLAAIQRNG